jgi:hypothetical protein
MRSKSSSIGEPANTDGVAVKVAVGATFVTCTVTDNWGISKVAFPTWTVANDQDDLAADFMNTQKGTQNGNTYTFRVEASDHNHESGQYVTHIYAVDKGGNQTKLVLDVVEVKDPVNVTVSAKSFSVSFEDEVLTETSETQLESETALQDVILWVNEQKRLDFLYF